MNEEEDLSFSSGDLMAYGSEYGQGDWLYFASDFPAYEDVVKGFDNFWNNTQVKEFPKDEKGNNLRDENGEIIVIRTNKPRKRLKTQLYFHNHNKRKTKTNNESNKIS
jgi:hypothetical protein